MSTRARTWLRVVVAWFLLSPLKPVCADDVLEEIGNAPTIAQLIENVDAQVGSTIDGVLADYDRIIEQQPYDVALRVQRCKFLDQYASSFETGSFLDEVYEKADECDRELEIDFPEHPEVLLSKLEDTYGEECLRQGKDILSTLLYEGWTHGQLARLYVAMANAAQATQRTPLGVEYARKALNFDETANVRLLLAREHLARGENTEVISLLRTKFDAANHGNSWYVLEKMQLLSRAGAQNLAAPLYEELAKTEYYNHLEAARALKDAHAIDLARKEIDKALEIFTNSSEDEEERFLLEFEHGDAEAALAAYNGWRDAGWLQDPIGVNRLALATRDAALPWRIRDVLALCSAVALLALAALACGAPVAIVHYWGFVRRHGRGESYPSEGWQLRHAWGALAAFGMVAVVSVYAAGPFGFDTQTMLQLSDLRPSQWARYAMAEGLLSTIAMVVVLRRDPTTEHAWSRNWSLVKAITLGAALGIAFRVPLGLAVLSQPDTTVLVTNDELWQMLRYVRDEMGLLSTLWLLAVVAPVVEEFIFRKVLLESFTAHIGFARANLLQAALFAAMHVDARAFLPLFGFGLLVGYLARRSGGLVAPMMTHAIFNLIAGVLLLK